MDKWFAEIFYFGYKKVVFPPKTSKMENVYLYTIAEFTHLFVDIKHMRPVTEIPVADLTFWFNGGFINMVDPFLHLVAQQPLQTVRMERG